MAASPTTGMAADDIDNLLERYLGLLDEYTRLRSTLSALQSSIYQNIARANFSAERGFRYDQEMFDERMQASRSLTITEGEGGVPGFEVGIIGEEEVDAPVKDEDAARGEEEKGANGAESEEKCEKEKEKAKAQNRRDPLRWFGILTPLPLRQAQSKSIEAVEEIIPKLLTVNAQMADTEVRVRRARKKRAKAEASVEKQQVSGGEDTPGNVTLSEDLEAHVKKLALRDEKDGPSEGVIA